MSKWILAAVILGFCSRGLGANGQAGVGNEVNFSRLLELQKETAGEGDKGRFKPWVGILISKLGWGGLGRSEAELAEKILIQIGKPAEEEVLLGLKADNTNARSQCARILVKIDPRKGIEVLPDYLKDQYVRREAIVQLGELGPAAAKAAEKIKACQDDPGVRVYVLVAMHRITGEVKPWLDELLKLTLDPEVSKDINDFPAEQIARLEDRKVLYPRLIEAMGNADVRIRLRALRVFHWTSPDAPEVVTTLIGLLKNEKEASVVSSVCSPLCRVGKPQSDQVVPELVDVLRRWKDDSVIGSACMALQFSDGAGVELAMDTLQKLVERDGDYGPNLVRVLAKLNTGKSFELATKMVESKRENTRRDLALFMPSFDKKQAGKANAILDRLANDQERSVREAVKEAREQMKRKQEDLNKR
jgi:hypothetical protein